MCTQQASPPRDSGCCGSGHCLSHECLGGIRNNRWHVMVTPVACVKLSYRRDSARRRSLRRSKSFKVNDVGTSRRPVCDFLLVNNILTYILFRTVFQLLSNTSQIIVFVKGCLWLMNSFSATSANIAVNHILVKTRFIGQFCLGEYLSGCDYFDVF